MLFDHLNLFRFSDFVLLLLFVLGVLCAVEYLLDQIELFALSAIPQGRGLVYPIP